MNLEVFFYKMTWRDAISISEDQKRSISRLPDGIVMDDGLLKTMIFVPAVFDFNANGFGFGGELLDPISDIGPRAVVGNDELEIATGLPEIAS